MPKCVHGGFVMSSHGRTGRTSQSSLATFSLFNGNVSLTADTDRALRNAYYPPHTHSGLTTHLILRGQLTIAYPEDPVAAKAKTTYGVGDRLDVQPNVAHEVWVGPEGCTYVIGE